MEKIYKYSVIALFTVAILFRVQIMYENKLDKLEYKLSEQLINYSFLAQSINYMTEVKKKLHDEPIYEWPVMLDDYTSITSPFGYRLLYNPFTGGSDDSDHKGLDLKGAYQARVIAVSDGIVVESYPVPNGYFKGHDILGGMIKIKHTDGTYSVYGHLSANYVSEYGNKKYVKAGQVIGRIGNTGKSYGSHLHFELHDINDKSIQPLFYLKNPELIK